MKLEPLRDYVAFRSGWRKGQLRHTGFAVLTDKAAPNTLDSGMRVVMG